MYKINLLFDNGDIEEQEEEFETYKEAEECALYLCSCYHQGSEILHMSNPGDYPYDENEEVDYEIFEK